MTTLQSMFSFMFTYFVSILSSSFIVPKNMNICLRLPCTFFTRCIYTNKSMSQTILVLWALRHVIDSRPFWNFGAVIALDLAHSTCACEPQIMTYVSGRKKTLWFFIKNKLPLENNTIFGLTALESNPPCIG